MCAASVNVHHMSKMIQIRNVPDEFHRTLKMRAAAAGLSLSDYIKQELGAIVERPTFEEINARVKARRSANLSREEILAAVHAGRDD